MSERLGTCLDCGQRFDQIPASFTGNKIRCPKCQGVVEIRATQAAASDDPPEDPVSDSEGPSKGSVKAISLSPEAPRMERPRRGIPVDRSIVRPKAKPQNIVPSAPPKPAPEVSTNQPKPAPTPPMAPEAPQSNPPITPLSPQEEATPTSGPSAEEKKQRAQEIIARARAKRVQAIAQEKAATQQKSSVPTKTVVETKSPAQPTPKKLTGPELIAQLKQKKAAAKDSSMTPAARRAPQASRSSKRKSNSKPAGKRQKREPREKPEAKSKLGLWIGLSLLLTVGGWSTWYLMNNEEEAQGNIVFEAAMPATATVESKPANSEALPPPAALIGVADDPSLNSELNSTDAKTTTVEPTGEEGSPSKKSTNQPAPKIAASAPFVVPHAGEPIITRGISDFHALDLTKAPPLSKWSGTSDEAWQDVQSKLALFLDDQGVRSTRAGDKLTKDGRDAYPAIINEMLKLDYATKEGHYIGGMLNDLIVKIGAGKNYGWKGLTVHDEGSEEFLTLALVNKKVVAAWQNRWVKQLAHNDSQWAGFITSTKARLAKEKAKSEQPTAAPIATPEDGLFDD